MRGKISFGVVEDILDRITPAYAGKKKSVCQAALYTVGSPPPMRGKISQVQTLSTLTGITPAYAGKNLVQRFAPAFSRDHPRLCGEKADTTP